MRIIGRIILWFFAVVGLLTVALVAGGVFLAVQYETEGPAAPAKMVLTIDLDRGVAERRETALLQRLGGKAPLILRDVVDAIEAARTDKRVAGLVLDFGGGGLSIAHAQELRRAIARFRAAGKVARSFAESFGGLGNGTIPYYLASATDEVWMQPSGTLGLIGLAIETPFAAEALDKLDVTARYDQRHEYKGAGEIFVRRGFSPEARETLQRLVDSWMGQIVGDVSAARKVGGDELRRLIDSAPLLAREATDAKLIDRLGYRDAFEKRVSADAGADAEWVPVERYLAFVDRPETTGPKVALIYGTGTIVPGAEKEGPFDRARRLGADTMAGAIAEAADDASIKAILLRIDSPGGSYEASDTVWRAIRRAREAGKPVIASMGRTAASGGYFIAMAADRVVAEPGTVTGSIGVFAVKFVTREFWRKLGVDWDRVQAGKHAAMWSVVGDYPPGGHERVAAILDAVYADFAGKAAAARGLNASQIDRVARGRVWSGEDAKRHGLVDELGGFRTAVDAVKTMLKLPAGASVTLVDVPKPSRFEQFLETLQKQGFDVDAMVASVRSLAASAWPFDGTALEPVAEELRDLAPAAGLLQMPALRLSR